MKNNVRIGSLGEDLAVKYLEDKCYKVIERNFRRSYGELDIVAKSPNGVLVFIEVKAMKQFGLFSENPVISPEDNMNRAKIIKTKKIAQNYANHHPEMIDESRGWRIDLIAISMDVSRETEFLEAKDYLTDYNKHCGIKHFENVN